MKEKGTGREGDWVVGARVEEEVRRAYKVEVIGHAEKLRERFYAISIEKRMQHPAVVAISKSARQSIQQE